MAFILMDSDADGRVSAGEVQAMLQRLGIHLREEIVVNLVRQASQSGAQHVRDICPSSREFQFVKERVDKLKLRLKEIRFTSAPTMFEKRERKKIHWTFFYN